MSVISLLSGQEYQVPTAVNFAIGGISGSIGQTATHPLDLTKIRMQILRTSLRNTLKDTWNTAGIRGFYVGWSAGLLRQLTYTTTRLGIYTTLFDLCESYFGRLNYPTMVGLGMISGIAGAFVGTPTDLVLIRMIADMKLPPGKRWNYKSAPSALVKIAKTEGIAELWKGAIPTMTRAAIVNGAQLGTYTKAKMMLKDTGLLEEGVALQFLSAMASGLVMCTTSLPVDVAKTRIQNWNLPAKPPGVTSMIVQIAQKEGIPSLWRGFLPYYSRSGPNAVITMVCLDQFHRLYAKLFIPSE